MEVADLLYNIVIVMIIQAIIVMTKLSSVKFIVQVYKCNGQGKCCQQTLSESSAGDINFKVAIDSIKQP